MNQSVSEMLSLKSNTFHADMLINYLIVWKMFCFCILLGISKQSPKDLFKET